MCLNMPDLSGWLKRIGCCLAKKIKQGLRCAGVRVLFYRFGHRMVNMSNTILSGMNIAITGAKITKKFHGAI